MQKLRSKLILSSVFVLFFFTNKCTTFNTSFSSKKLNSFEQVYQNSIALPEFDYLNARYSLKITSDNKTKNFSGKVQYINDSVLLLNMVSKALGIEIFRAYCTPDSLFFIDRVNKRHYASNYGYLKQYSGIEVNYFTLRAIFIGKVNGMAFDYDNSRLNFFKAKQNNSLYNFEYSMNTIDKNSLADINYPYISHKFSVSDNGNICKSYFKDINSNKYINIDYKSHIKFSLPINISLESLINNSKTVLNIEYTSVSFKKFDISYKVPKSYTLMQ